MSIECPKCGSVENFRPVKVEDTNGSNMLLPFGLMAYLVHKESHKNTVLCQNCGLVFSPKKKSSWLADLAVFLLLAILIFGGIGYLLYLDNPSIFK